jgi:hypothetical protein
MWLVAESSKATTASEAANATAIDKRSDYC